ncbi:hypothetical protein VNI00_012160 [Paramarasmius palmivorus]|uniref:Glycoside hydrolase family 76 protein n=1 Tax=Paramarasmius palmivorus TaxID=297713 RepID=A0AAW0C6M2_9AGAR
MAADDLLALAQICIHMAEYDALTGQSQFRQALTGYISEGERVQPGFVSDSTRGGIGFGYAAARAYEAYRDESFLDFAKMAWDSGRRVTISDDDVSAGVILAKDFTLQKNCRGASMAGGTFKVRFIWTDIDTRMLTEGTQSQFNGTSNATIDSWTTGLSAALYRITLDERFLSAANAAAKFLRDQLYQDRLFTTSLSGREQDECLMDLNITTYENGIVMQGIALLNEVTNFTTEYNALVKDLVTTVTSKPAWHSDAGILTAQDVGKNYIPRGLMQVYNTSTDAVLQDYITAYLSTQYAAVAVNAAGYGDIYGSSWTGPAASHFDDRGQSEAISALLATIVVSPEDGSNTVVTTSSSIPSASMTPSSTSSVGVPIGPIVGGTMGGLAVISILVTVVLCHRRRTRSMGSSSIDAFPVSQEAAPDLFQTQILPRQAIYRKQFPSGSEEPQQRVVAASSHATLTVKLTDLPDSSSPPPYSRD